MSSDNLLPLEKRLNYKYPLENLLSDDRALACIKEMGKEIKKYLNPEKIKQLIILITKEPDNDDILTGHKYPYIACEIFKAECPFILERFVLTNEEFYKKYKKIVDEQIKEKFENSYILRNGKYNEEKEENEKDIKNNSKVNFDKNIDVIEDKNNIEENKNNLNCEKQDEYEKKRENLLKNLKDESDKYKKDYIIKESNNEIKIKNKEISTIEKII